MKSLKTKEHNIFIYDNYKKTGVYGLRKWINALRSGKFKQGTGGLYNKSDDCYCCIGVYETVVAHYDILYLIDDPDQGFLHEKGLKTSCELFNRNSPLLSDRSGYLPKGAGYLTYDSEVYMAKNWGRKDRRHDLESFSLMGLNDSLRLTFDDIADLLELLFFDVS